MKTNSNTPTIFRPEFNQAQTINATQAWSLFFSGGWNLNGLGTASGLGNTKSPSKV